jgi:hypothetical protein
MSFTLVWQYVSPTASQQDSYPQVLIPHPGTWSDSEAEAVKEARDVHGGDELTDEERDALTPLVVVEVTEDMGDDIQEKCEEVEVGTDLLFYDLDQYPRWQDQAWWPKS